MMNFSKPDILTGLLWLALTAFARMPLLAQEDLRGDQNMSSRLQGIWEDADAPGFFLEVRDHQILIASSGRVREAATILHPIDDGLLVCEDGYDLGVQVHREGEQLLFFHLKDGKQRHLTRIHSRPAALDLALPIPAPMALSEEEILSIQREIWLRRQQEIGTPGRGVPIQPPSLPWLEDSGTSSPAWQGPLVLNLRGVDRSGANADYLRALVQRVGWIDAKRFGYAASQAAFFLVQHSWDLALMLSVLPWIERDVAAGLMDGGAYALMFDRAQLTLGRPQRFGSQIGRDASGDAFVLPLENPEGVDARRKEWGLQPLKEYVALFGAAEVRLSTECASLTRAPLALKSGS